LVNACPHPIRRHGRAQQSFAFHIHTSDPIQGHACRTRTAAGQASEEELADTSGLELALIPRLELHEMGNMRLGLARNVGNAMRASAVWLGRGNDCACSCSMRPSTAVCFPMLRCADCDQKTHRTLYSYILHMILNLNIEITYFEM
jgi:hypothetical protein